MAERCTAIHCHVVASNLVAHEKLSRLMLKVGERYCGDSAPADASGFRGGGERDQQSCSEFVPSRPKAARNRPLTSPRHARPSGLVSLSPAFSLSLTLSRRNNNPTSAGHGQAQRTTQHANTPEQTPTVRIHTLLFPSCWAQQLPDKRRLLQAIPLRREGPPRLATVVCARAGATNGGSPPAKLALLSRPALLVSCVRETRPHR
jgi:hypothetical protein